MAVRATRASWDTARDFSISQSQFLVQTLRKGFFNFPESVFSEDLFYIVERRQKHASRGIELVLFLTPDAWY